MPESRLNTTLTLLALAVLKEKSLAEDLHRLASLATRHIPNSSAASMALLVDGRPSTVTVTDHVALELDLVQYEEDEGPCITALAGHAVRVAFLPTDERFPHFAMGAADQRILSVQSVPILYGNETIGTLNIYSREPDAFDDHDLDTARLIAAEASNALAKSELLSSARTIREQLQATHDEHSLVTRAQGVLMAVQHCSDEQAQHLIENAAERNDEPLLLIAQRILESVTAGESPTTSDDG